MIITYTLASRVNSHKRAHVRIYKIYLILSFFFYHKAFLGLNRKEKRKFFLSSYFYFPLRICVGTVTFYNMAVYRDNPPRCWAICQSEFLDGERTKKETTNKTGVWIDGKLLLLVDALDSFFSRPAHKCGPGGRKRVIQHHPASTRLLVSSGGMTSANQ